MGYKILIICLFVVFYACRNNPKTDTNTSIGTNSNETKVEVSLTEFKEWNEQKQADYLNKLGEKERMIYVVAFLKDAVIFMPPNDWVKFNKNGDISDHHSISRNTNLGIIGKWIFENDKIIITPVGDGKGMEEIFGAKEFTWKNVSAEAPQNISPTILGLNFDDGYLLQYAKADQ